MSSKLYKTILKDLWAALPRGSYQKKRTQLGYRDVWVWAPPLRYRLYAVIRKHRRGEA